MSVKSKLLCCSALVFVVASPVHVHAETNASKWAGFSAFVGGSTSFVGFNGIAEASSFDGKDASAYVPFDFFEQGEPQGIIGAAYDFEVSPNFIAGVRGLARFGAPSSFDENFDDSYSGKDSGGGSLDYFGELGNSFELSGRLGWTPNANALLYVVAGVAIAETASGGYYDPEDGGSFEWDGSGTVQGQTVGLGVEIDVGNGMSVGLEISQAVYSGIASSYDDKDFGATAFDATQNSVSVFLGKRF